MGLKADIYFDVSCNQPFQQGADSQGIIGENACGVGITITNTASGMEPLSSKHQYGNSWIACVTPGLCELASLCFGLVHLRLMHQQSDYSHRYSGQTLSGLSIISIFTDSKVAFGAMQSDYVVSCPWVAIILYQINKEKSYWIRNSVPGLQVQVYKLERTDANIRVQDQVANDLRIELHEALLSHASGMSPMIADFPRHTRWRVQDHWFQHGDTFSRGMSELFLQSRDIHDSMWSETTHKFGTIQAAWCWQSRGELDINHPNFSCFGMLTTSSTHFSFQSLFGKLIHPISGHYPFFPFRDCAIADLVRRQQSVVRRPRLCFRD